MRVVKQTSVRVYMLKYSTFVHSVAINIFVQIYFVFPMLRSFDISVVIYWTVCHVSVDYLSRVGNENVSTVVKDEILYLLEFRRSE